MDCKLEKPITMRIAEANKVNRNSHLANKIVMEAIIETMNKNNRKEHYNKKGMYAGYDKNHKERDALNYYSTPVEELTKILNVL